MQVVVLLLLRGASLFGQSGGSAPRADEVEPGRVPLSEPAARGDGLTLPAPANSGSTLAAPPTFHLRARTPFTRAMGLVAYDPDRPVDVICSFAANLVAESGRSVACNVELLRDGWIRRLRITKSDTRAVLIDCEIDQKSKAKVAARANVNVLAETKRGSGRLAITSLAFETEEDAHTFVRPFD
jgi:hypothetical protein